MKTDKMILRTRYADRLCHWLMVLCFIPVALSGLSWFFPSLHWLSGLYGTPQLARILHPFFGVGVFCALMFLAVRLVRYNLPEKGDGRWFANIRQVLSGSHEQDLDIGKYNPGQKVLFWGIMSLITCLLLSGVVIWRPYFAPAFPIPAIRIGLLLHALAGVGLMLLILGHVYLALWVKGSIPGMISGYVSRAWARQHHSRWYRQVTGKAKSAD